MIIGLHGYAQSGKDTAAGILRDKGFHQLAFADALREIASIIDPVVGLVDGELLTYNQAIERYTYDIAKVKFEQLRLFLQRFATDGVRERIDVNAWVRLLDERVTAHSGDNIVISDARFWNEAQYIADRGPIISIRRPGVGPINAHSSETDLDEWPFDYIINNDGTLEDFSDKIEVVLQEIGFYNATEHGKGTTPLAGEDGRGA